MSVSSAPTVSTVQRRLGDADLQTRLMKPRTTAWTVCSVSASGLRSSPWDTCRESSGMTGCTLDQGACRCRVARRRQHRQGAENVRRFTNPRHHEGSQRRSTAHTRQRSSICARCSNTRAARQRGGGRHRAERRGLDADPPDTRLRVTWRIHDRAEGASANGGSWRRSSLKVEGGNLYDRTAISNPSGQHNTMPCLAHSSLQWSDPGRRSTAIIMRTGRTSSSRWA